MTVTDIPGLRVQNVTFEVSKDVLERGVRVVVFVMGGLRNVETDPEFEALRKASSQRILDTLSEQSIREDKILQGFRDLHTAIGFSNRNFLAASESLLAYLLKNRSLPRINVLVDLYNLISVETRLALGAHDLAKVSGNIHLRVTSGSEEFVPLGSVEPKPVRPGGYAYVDDDNDVICLLEVKQVEKTKATLNTTECLYIVQGNAETELEYIQAAADRLTALTKQFCGGQERFLYRGYSSS